MKWFLQILVVCTFFVSGLTQAQEIDQRSVLFQLHAGFHAKEVLQQVAIGDFLPEYQVNQISRNLNAYKISYQTSFSPHKLVELLKSFDEVILAQPNHILTSRAFPNDLEYGNQWHLNNTGNNGPPAANPVAGVDINAEYLWDFTTGGVTAAGDTIVVCIVDDGIDENHEDFTGNLFYNQNEIPLNGIDDDNNGYVDDYRGWNAFGDNDSLTNPSSGDLGLHGTKVSGIIGAVGNNSLGISGVNHQIKLMTVIGGGDEAEAIEAYDYPLTMRKLYNNSNGQSGAFIVATNTSWGTNFGQPADAPLWCSMYDSLGQEGILNVAATINFDTDVDLDGDLPTTCPSDYLIAVTNINSENKKERYAGYGVESIDLGAPGEGIYTTTFNNNYGYDSGTSFASPQVVGAIGLLSSYACLNFAELLMDDPDSAAVLMKSFILNGATGVPDLYGKSVAQGRLDLKQASRWLDNYCTGNVGLEEQVQSTSEIKLYPNPANSLIQVVGTQEYFQLKIYNMQGRLELVKNQVRPGETFNVESLSEGVYICSMATEKQVFQLKFVKK